ncbi:MAG: peptide chain release factor 1 [Deltaproteobacteria bacterium]|jgi:peptide chain release factor 1|nr:peptide chain release factor 1 [Deltaproteobacteria bacterium]
MDKPKFISKVQSLLEYFEKITKKMATPEIATDIKKLTELSKERSDLEPLITQYKIYSQNLDELKDAKAMAKDPDPEIQELAREEVKNLQNNISDLENDMKMLLLPKDPLDKKNILLEIRAGTGGEEAALFAGNLFRMYSYYAENHDWKVEIMSASYSSTKDGFKEVIAMIKGKEVYSQLRFESGVHRVQRVPSTESQGRVHTSAATVAVLPEAEDIEVNIDDKELRIDVMRASGPGGQSVNKTDSAVRITHLPTGMIVTCQDEKSQHKNKAKAMKILKTRLFEKEREKQESARRDKRRDQVGSGDRSEKIRTYNYPQDRLTDHRINYTRHNLDAVMDGDLNDVVSRLRAHHQAQLLKEGIH